MQSICNSLSWWIPWLINLLSPVCSLISWRTFTMSLLPSVESPVTSTVLTTITDIHMWWNKWMNQEMNYTLQAYANPRKITLGLDGSYKPFIINNFVMIICVSLYFNAFVWLDLGVISEVLWPLEISFMSIDIYPTNGTNFQPSP